MQIKTLKIEESWFLQTYFLTIIVKRDTNKIYVPHRIAISDFKPSVMIINQYGHIRRKIPIKKIRSKSFVLNKPVKTNERIMVVYEYWECSRQYYIKIREDLL